MTVIDDCDGVVGPNAWANHCTAGTSENGCTPSLSASGSPSLSGTVTFERHASGLDGQRSALIFWGLASNNVAWAPGSASTSCVQLALTRCDFSSTGGTPGACDGSISGDWLSYMQTHPNVRGQPIAPGQAFYAQGYYRDPGAPRNANLTDALTFTVCP